MKNHPSMLIVECRRLVDEIYDIHFEFEETRRDDLIRLGLDISADVPEYQALFSALLPLLTDREHIVNQPEIIDEIENAYQSAPDDRYILTCYATCLFFTRHYDRAKELIEKVLALASDFRPALQLQSMILQKSGRPADALIYLDRILSFNADDFRAMELKSDCLADLGLHQEAIANDEALFDAGLNYICSRHPALALQKITPNMVLPLIYEKIKNISTSTPYSDIRVLGSVVTRLLPTRTGI